MRYPRRSPARSPFVGELLTSHPEAESLLAEASHCRALAVCSAVFTRVKFATAQAARLAYEELRHRLEPRRRHPVHFGVGLLLALHDLSPHPGAPPGSGHDHDSTIFGVLAGVFILVLTAGAVVSF